MIRCGECKYWAEPSIEGSREDHDDLKKSFRECGRIVMSARRSRDADSYQLAQTVDGSGYFAALLTLEDFGCAAGEPREASDDESLVHG